MRGEGGAYPHGFEHRGEAREVLDAGVEGGDRGGEEGEGGAEGGDAVGVGGHGDAMGPLGGGGGRWVCCVVGGGDAEAVDVWCFGVAKSTSSGGVNSDGGDEVVCAVRLFGVQIPLKHGPYSLTFTHIPGTVTTVKQGGDVFELSLTLALV